MKKKRPVLTRLEERELARRVAAGDVSARDELVARNLGLVHLIARRFMGRGLDPEDLAQEGQLGLLRAVELFEPEKGFKFSTYATHWIRSKIQRALREQAKLVHVPSHRYDHVTAWKKTERRLVEELGREPRVEEIAKASGLDAARTLLAIAATKGTASLDRASSNKGEVVSWIETVTDPQDDQGTSERLDEVRTRLATLPERERQILILRFGLEGHAPHTLAAAGAAMKLSRERVRQLEKTALASLLVRRPVVEAPVKVTKPARVARPRKAAPKPGVRDARLHAHTRDAGQLVLFRAPRIAPKKRRPKKHARVASASPVPVVQLLMFAEVS